MIRVSEIFYSIEGEGPLTGRPTLFVRFFGCNFTCSGFGTVGIKHDTGLKYVSPETREDLSKYHFRTGCDSAYSWDPAFKHLSTDYTVETLAQAILDTLNANVIPGAPLPILCFTGGEPMLYQKHFLNILERVESSFDLLLVETNGSIYLDPEFNQNLPIQAPSISVLWSISPKLSNSGEPREKAIRKNVIDSLGRDRYFKFVTDGSPESIAEINSVLAEYGGDYGDAEYPGDYVDRANTWLMPEGAALDQQKAVQRKVANACLKYGFNFCARVHVWVFDNEIGT